MRNLPIGLIAGSAFLAGSAGMELARRLPETVAHIIGAATA